MSHVSRSGDVLESPRINLSRHACRYAVRGSSLQPTAQVPFPQGGRRPGVVISDKLSRHSITRDCKPYGRWNCPVLHPDIHNGISQVPSCARDGCCENPKEGCQEDEESRSLPPIRKDVKVRPLAWKTKTASQHAISGGRDSGSESPKGCCPDGCTRKVPHDEVPGISDPRHGTLNPRETFLHGGDHGCCHQNPNCA